MASELPHVSGMAAIVYNLTHRSRGERACAERRRTVTAAAILRPIYPYRRAASAVAATTACLPAADAAAQATKADAVRKVHAGSTGRSPAAGVRHHRRRAVIGRISTTRRHKPRKPHFYSLAISIPGMSRPVLSIVTAFSRSEAHRHARSVLRRIRVKVVPPEMLPVL